MNNVSNKPSKVVQNIPPLPLTSYFFFQGKFGVRGVFFPAGNYFLNPRQMQKNSHRKIKDKKNYMTHTKSQPIFFSFQYQLSCRSRSDSNCFIVTRGKKKPCGLPRISYFSKGFCADMQKKSSGMQETFFFSFQKYFHLVPRPKLQINWICRFSGVILHDPSLISENLSYQAACTPSSAKSESLSCFLTGSVCAILVISVGNWGDVLAHEQTRDFKKAVLQLKKKSWWVYASLLWNVEKIVSKLELINHQKEVAKQYCLVQLHLVNPIKWPKRQGQPCLLTGRHS